jgi:hypothetical protein
MTSRRALTGLAIIIWAAVAITAAPRALSHHHARLTVVSAEDSPAESCSDLHVRFEPHDAVVQSEERTITKAEAPALRVQAESNGGLDIRGWDKDDYSATLCKAAEAGADADSILSHIHLSFQGGFLKVTGPSSHSHWSAHILLRAPKAAVLDVQTHNGPLAIYNVDGNIKARAQNGPMTVTRCSGELDLATENGPLTLEENSGKQNVRSENGPLTLTLSGDSWTGAGLEARSTNGPVTLEVPSGYKSGVLLESEGGSPFQCTASVCSEGRKTWDDDHKRIEFGSGPTLVRVSTTNGPVSVR